MMPLKGVVPNLVTPMTSSAQVDTEATARLVDFVIGAGVGGIWALGSAGEDVHISHRDRLEFANSVIRAVDGRIPLMIGLGTAAYHDILSFVDACEIQPNVSFHFLPYDLKINDAGLTDYILTLADRLPCPLWLYHNTKRGRPVTLTVVKSVKEHPNVCGIKVGGYNLTELTAMSMLHSPNFQVSGAGSGQMFQILSLGLDAHMTSDASCYPEVFVELYELLKAGERQAALQLQHKIINLSTSIPRNGNGEYAAEEKYILKKRGIINDHVNMAYRKPTLEEKATIDASLQDFGFTWA